MKKRIQYNLKLIKDFIDSDTPINVIYKYYASKIDSKKNIKLYRKNVLEFDEKIKKLHLSSNWFSQNIPFWLSVFEKLNIDKNIQLNCLEIGSWE